MSVRLLVRKLADAIVLLAMVLVFNFFLFRVVDRDPLARYRGRSKLSQEQRAAIIDRFGLDGSKWEQFVQYISRTLRGDFGRSFDSTRTVSSEILDSLPNTLLLVGISTVLTIGIRKQGFGPPLGSRVRISGNNDRASGAKTVGPNNQV